MQIDVTGWLGSLGLAQYVELFAANAIDAEVLPDLTDDELKELGVPLGHRKKLLKAIAELNGGAAPTASVTETPASITAAAPTAKASELGERRQLTVLFCDMVGFTELANRVDPEVLQRIIRIYEDACAVCITRYEGYVFQRLGDGIVAFFGYPLAHEAEAERAIRAGLEIIEALSKLDVPDVGYLAVRIGIATGLVVVSSVEKGAVGETMNLASRLQGIAPVGSIVVSERVHRLAGGSFDYADLGEQSLKGIARPTRAYRILRVSEAASRFEAATQDGLTSLVGREQEIGLLLERWALAQDGEGQVVLLSGEPGIGKSRILSALRERLEAQGAQALRFQCSPYYINSAFWPSIDNFERALKFGRDEPAESKLDKLEALIVTHYGRPLSDVRFIASMLSIPCEERYGATCMTPQKHKDETLRTLVDLTEAAARKQPSVMLFEDAHWADPTTLEVLDLLIDRVRAIPLLIVLTHRPEFQSRWAQHGHVIGLNLSKLTRTQSGAMISKLAGGKALPANLLEQILTKTDGVPLFVEELTKSILESGELKEAGDHYDYAGTAHTVTIPATLRDSLMARLDRFIPVKEIAQIGAAIGREFSYELIEAVAPRAKNELDSALRQLTDSGLAFRRGTPPDAFYTFKHALVQDAAYDSLLKSRRQELHAKIAREIEERFPSIKTTEPELLAHHLTAAGQTQPAIGYWRKAGELALKRMAPAEAVSHLTKGLELVAALPPSAEHDGLELDLRVPLGTAWMALGGWFHPKVPDALTRAASISKSLGRHDMLALSLWGLGIHLLTIGRVVDSQTVFNEMLAEGANLSNEEFMLIADSAATVGAFWSGDIITARRHCEKVKGTYDRSKHAHLVALTNHDPHVVAELYAAHYLWLLGYPDAAARASEETERVARGYGHVFDLGFALTLGAWAFMYRREGKRFAVQLDKAEKLGREQGLPFFSECETNYVRGFGLLYSGKPGEALAQFQKGLAIRAHLGGWIARPIVYTGCAQAALEMGENDLAIETIDMAIEQIKRPGWGERAHLAEVLRVRGDILVRKNRTDEAESDYRHSLAWARKQQAKSWELRTSTSLARLWEGQGKRKEACDLLAPIYDWFTEGFDTKDLKEAKVLLSELA